MKSHKHKTNEHDKFEQEDYDLLYNVMKESYKIVSRFESRYGGSIKYRVIVRSQRVISEVNYKYLTPPINETVYRALKNARKAMYNPAFSNINGVRVVNDIFDLIDNISNTKPADVESSMVELKDTVKSMNRLNEEAKTVSGKCEVIADNLSNICKYMNGEAENIVVNNSQKS